MRPLTKVPTPPAYKSRYDLLVAAKRSSKVKARLLAIDGAITVRYAQLEAAVDAGTLHTLIEDVTARDSRDDLQSCYKNKTKPMLEVLEAIRASQNPRYLERCPYCGITLPRTYDHYLPKERFPEFSIHPLNIMPCCADCNSSKGSRWLQHGDRLFLHYYSDPLPEQRYLFVTVMQKANGAGYATNFTIRRPMGYSAINWRLLEAHYTKLNLLERYRLQANYEIANLFDIAVTFVQSGGSTDVGAFLNTLCDKEAAIFGVSHWRTVLKRELAESEVFKNRAVAAGLDLI